MNDQAAQIVRDPAEAMQETTKTLAHQSGLTAEAQRRPRDAAP